MTKLSATNIDVTLERAPIVNNVSFTVAQGQWLAIIGPNGAGKSTLLKAVCGLIPHKGKVLVEGVARQNLARRQWARHIAYAPQIPVMPATMLVNDYVLLGRLPYLGYLGRESRHDHHIAVEALAQLDLTPLAQRPLGSLSGGEQQRVVLARTLAQQAEILLLDEPTSALDLGHQQQLLELIDALRHTNNLTVITTLHDLTIAGQYADELLMLAGGKVVAVGPPKNVLIADIIAEHYDAAVSVETDNVGHPIVRLVRRKAL